MIKKYFYEPLAALSNNYKCPRCGARVKIPLDAPGQLELFPPNCHNCGAEMRLDNI
jgi:DNA-directed RNA polymerase subunit RPC12/RpoP